jgi:hypothetical protein
MSISTTAELIALAREETLAEVCKELRSMGRGLAAHEQAVVLRAVERVRAMKREAKP